MKALITGASSGIGRDMARILSKKGYELVLVARDNDKLKEVKEELEKETKVEIISVDLTNEENCKEIHNKVQNVDLLINNAGFGDCGDFTKTSLEKDINMIKTNIIAYHILTKLYLKDMKEKNKGDVYKRQIESTKFKPFFSCQKEQCKSLLLISDNMRSPS